MSTFASQTWWLLQRKLLETWRAPAWIVVGLSTPLLYLALFGPLLNSLVGAPGFPSGSSALDIFVPGVLVIVAFGAGMGAGWTVITELDTGVLERLRVTPASRLALLLGPVLRDVVTFAVPAIVVTIAAQPFGYHPDAAGTAVLLILLSLLTVVVSAWSNALGMLLGDIGSLASIVTGLQLPLTLLSGVLLPLEIGPTWMRVLAHTNPLYYAVNAARDLAQGSILTTNVGVAFGAAVALFWLRSSNPLVPIVFTAVVLLGWGLFSTGPLIIGGLGRLLARRARRPATLLAGRFLADSPGSAWRTVSGFALAAFLAGFIAATLPLGLRGVGDFENRADRLEAVAPAATIETQAAEARAVLGAADIQADVEVTASPFWLDEAEWATLTLTVNDPEVERERARTTMIESGLWGPEMQMAEDLPTKWLVLDGVVIGVVVMPIAALVALATMVIGTIARIYDRREALIALRLAGTPPGVLSSAQRYELVLPTALVGAIAAIAGLLSGSTSGGVSLLNAYSTGIFAGLFSIGAIALWLAGRASHPVLERVSTDLTERE